MKTFALLAGLALATSLILTNCTQTEKTAADSADAAPEPASQASEETLVERGAYLVTVMGCNDCHTPKVMTEQGPAPDLTRLLSGHPADEKLPEITDTRMSAPGNWALFNGSLTAAVGPWGTTFAANLTPDETGLGNWTIDNFKRALREGKYKGLDGGRMLLPPMPWQNFTGMHDEDVEAIWAYLRSVRPVKNIVPAPIPPVAG